MRRAPLPADAMALVRGDTGEPDQDRQDALAFRRRFADWPGYGVSGFYAVTEEGIDDLARDLLQRFRLLRIYDPGGSWRRASSCSRPSEPRTSLSVSPTSTTALPCSRPQ